jgi:hypothetical protein
MLKANVFVITFGIIVGGLINHLLTASIKGELGSVMSAWESKLDNISQRTVDSRCHDQEMKMLSSNQDPSISLVLEDKLSGIEERLQYSMETSMRTIIQEELEFALSQMPTDSQIMDQSVQYIEPQLHSENVAKADQVLSVAIGDGVWTQDNMDAYNAATSNLSGKALAEAQRKFAVAVNNGDIYINEDVIFQ